MQEKAVIFGDEAIPNMLISIITPSRNQGQYIKHCLDSIFNQTYREIEHIIMDGLSTDETALVVSAYPSRLLQQKDSGPAQAINRGFDLASGQIICWLNADDAFADPEVLESVVEMFLLNPEIDVITGNGYYINDAGTFISPIIPDYASRMSHAWMRRSDPFLQPATFWRRNSIRLNENLKYTFDWQLWLDFYAAGLNIRYTSQCFALYRIQSGSLTQQDRPQRREEIYKTISRYSDIALQRWWCWLVWKAHVVDAMLNTTFLRKITKSVNHVLSVITAGKITWG